MNGYRRQIAGGYGCQGVIWTGWDLDARLVRFDVLDTQDCCSTDLIEWIRSLLWTRYPCHKCCIL